MKLLSKISPEIHPKILSESPPEKLRESSQIIYPGFFPGITARNCQGYIFEITQGIPFQNP